MGFPPLVHSPTGNRVSGLKLAELIRRAIEQFLKAEKEGGVPGAADKAAGLVR